ncbi:hypothetical protein [Robbsia andropogonis]|uniref:hypothetical protein n=1 Tax=Robbsia andropogonis TaxID=28092 RepID=UPI002A6B08CF|nr:hypothetical protein [Robbsia andropogonis]
MAALDTLDRLYGDGFRVTLDETGSRLYVSPKNVPAYFLAQLRADKEAIIDLLRHPVDPESGARFMPWCAPMTLQEFHDRRAELIDLIEEIADLEWWSPGDLDDVMHHAVNGPVSDLMPNLHYFREHVVQARSRGEACEPRRRQR